MDVCSLSVSLFLFVFLNLSNKLLKTFFKKSRKKLYERVYGIDERRMDIVNN